MLMEAGRDDRSRRRRRGRILEGVKASEERKIRT